MKIYLDNAATTKTDPRVVKAMLPYFDKKFGNPSSIHSFGAEALEGVDKSRGQVADFLGCKPEEIIFTSGATEANNAVIKVVPELVKAESKGRNKIVTSAIEHHCVFDSVKAMEKRGFKVEFLPIDKNGIVNLEKAKKAIGRTTALVSIMYANNEIGTIQPIKEIAKLAKKAGAPMHTDAVQAINYLDCKVDNLGIDYLSMSAHKFYGPKGVGVLFRREGAPLEPYQHGGAQEFNLRAGTLNTPGIVGLGKALELGKKERKTRKKRILALRKLLTKLLKNELGSDIKVNGSLTKRLPNNLNVSFKNVEGEGMLLGLDLEGIAASTGSACSSMSLQPSHVLMALHDDVVRSHGSIRFSLGKDTTKAEIEQTAKIVAKVYRRLKALSPLT